jgi:hypothetical protein
VTLILDPYSPVFFLKENTMAKKIIIIFGGVVLLGVLAAAAFLGMRLINARASGSNLSGKNGPMMALSGGSGGGKVSIQIQITPAAELPQMRADLVGEVKEIKDNSLTVAQAVKGGNLTVSKGTSNDGPSEPQSNMSTDAASGPTTEVVVTKDTKIYRDTTMENAPKPQPGESTSISMQQKLEEADMTQISSGNMVQVWGQKRGDRLIADTIVSMGPAVIMFKPGQ